MLRIKIILIIFLIFTMAKSKPIIESDEDLTEERSLVESFTSNSKFHSVFNNDKIDESLVNRFLADNSELLDRIRYGDYSFHLTLLEDDEDYAEMYGEDNDDSYENITNYSQAASLETDLQYILNSEDKEKKPKEKDDVDKTPVRDAFKHFSNSSKNETYETDETGNKQSNTSVDNVSKVKEDYSSENTDNIETLIGTTPGTMLFTSSDLVGIKDIPLQKLPGETQKSLSKSRNNAAGNSESEKIGKGATLFVSNILESNTGQDENSTKSTTETPGLDKLFTSSTDRLNNTSYQQQNSPNILKQRTTNRPNLKQNIPKTNKDKSADHPDSLLEKIVTYFIKKNLLSSNDQNDDYERFISTARKGGKGNMRRPVSSKHFRKMTIREKEEV